VLEESRGGKGEADNPILPMGEREI